MLSTLPLGFVKNFGANDAVSERNHVSTLNDDDRHRFEKTEHIKRIKQLRMDGKTNRSNTNMTPNSNLSFMTINSNPSKNKLLNLVRAGKAAAAAGGQTIIQPSPLSAPKTNDIAGKLSVTSNLLNKIKQKQQMTAQQVTTQATAAIRMNDNSARLSHKPVVPGKIEAGTSGPTPTKGKLFSIALNNAKNVNMFEINNYFHSPRDESNPTGTLAGIPQNESSVSYCSNSPKNTSKRFESKMLEITKLRTKLRENHNTSSSGLVTHKGMTSAQGRGSDSRVGASPRDSER